MDIIILGAGNTGAFVASMLSQQQHNVTVIDKDANALERVGRELDVATSFGHFPNWKGLTDLAKQRPDLFFAATGSDETNLVSCSVAKRAGFPKTIARVKSSEYLQQDALDFGALFGVDHFIGAEILAAQDLFKVLVHTAEIAVEQFAHGAIQMKTILIPQTWGKAELSIRDLKLPKNLIVALIHRNKEGQIEDIIPHGEDCLLPGDEATFRNRR